MLEKLLANLPYNQNLTKQIAFYARRLKREQSVRRTGIAFMVLAFTVQFFAFLSPPQPTTAYSTSDMINGGINSKEDAVRACRENTKNYGDALWNFKITCDDVSRTSMVNVRSTDHDNRIFTMGWLPYGNVNQKSGKQTDETPLNLAKVSDTLYGRRLSSFDTIPFSTYQMLKGTTADGRTFYIMKDCGNLALIGVPNPVEVCRQNGEYFYKGDRRCETFEYTTSYEATCPYDRSIPKKDKRCVACPYNDQLPKDSPRCKPCDAAVGSANGLACIVESKKAANQTQKLADAHNTLAQPNDVIVYTLFAENIGEKDVNKFVMQENLSDVLDYADVVDLGGGKLSKTNLLSWPSASIKAGGKLSHRITVRIKNPLPTNPPSISDPNHYDHVLTNVYGNTVTINVPMPPGVAPVASASNGETLTKTGPAEGLALAAAVTIVAGYFFARARLLADESMVIVQETTSGTL